MVPRRCAPPPALVHPPPWRGSRRHRALERGAAPGMADGWGAAVAGALRTPAVPGGGITRLGQERTRESRPRETQQRFVQRRRMAGGWV